MSAKSSIKRNNSISDYLDTLKDSLTSSRSEPNNIFNTMIDGLKSEINLSSTAEKKQNAKIKKSLPENLVTGEYKCQLKRNSSKIQSTKSKSLRRTNNSEPALISNKNERRPQDQL